MKLLVSADSRAAEKLLSGAQRRLQEPALFRELGDAARRASAAQFASGAGWSRPQDGGRPLWRTGTLRDSLAEAGSRFQSFRVAGDYVEIESTVPYAKYQRNDPSRVNKAALERDAVSVLQAYLMED